MTSSKVSRLTLDNAVEDKLFFAQVREDPQIEIDALGVSEKDHVVIVSSGGCTGLSLLASGAGKVTCVDLNTAQNHLVELKICAINSLSQQEVLMFLGAIDSSRSSRWNIYKAIREGLTPQARAYWDSHKKSIKRGVIDSGVSEKFVRIIAWSIRRLIHSSKKIDAMLGCTTLDEQRAYYNEYWNTRRWKLLFLVLLNRFVFRKTYAPGFFEHVENPSFAKHFYGLVEHVLSEVPIGTNYFFHQMLTRHYKNENEALPVYLQENSLPAIKRNSENVTLVDAAYGDYLLTLEDNTVDVFVLSNICEWLTETQIEDFFGEILRTARPGARLLFRNFVGLTCVPDMYKDVIIENESRGVELIKNDRSGVQWRVAICDIKKQ